MKTISLSEFTSNFMEISNNLTASEVRMLYLLITQPDVIKISQQMFASKIGTHRRTISIGYKTLTNHGYITIPDNPSRLQQNIGVNIMSRHAVKNNVVSTDINNTGNGINSTDIKIEIENNEKIKKNENSVNTRSEMADKNESVTSGILYKKFLQEILGYKKYAIIPQFFEEFPDKHTDILIDLRTELPDFIDFLAIKYGFEEELRILRISNSQIKELKKNILHKENLCNELSANYIKYFRQERKKLAVQVIRQALIYYPFKFEKFLHDIREYRYDDFDEIVQAMIWDIYKTDRLNKKDNVSSNP
jgi:hypothetical protein